MNLEVSMSKILLVDDEADIIDPLTSILTDANYRVRAMQDPLDALQLLKTQSFDLAILDIKMPQMTGYQLFTEVKKLAPNLPIIFLSSASEEQDQIIGFTLGADDFVAKPFSKHLLLFRIQAVLRRYRSDSQEQSNFLEAGRLSIDRGRHLVTWNGTPLDLTVTECMMLIALSERPGLVKKRDQLMDAAYDGAVYVSDRTIDSHIRNLRAKFKKADAPDDLIKTVHGLGYKLQNYDA